MVGAVCCVYCVEVAGSSIDLRKMDLFEAYAIRSPLASADSGVGKPRVVVGSAAKMLSGPSQHLFAVHVAY